MRKRARRQFQRQKAIPRDLRRKYQREFLGRAKSKASEILCGADGRDSVMAVRPRGVQAA